VTAVMTVPNYRALMKPGLVHARQVRLYLLVQAMKRAHSLKVRSNSQHHLKLKNYVYVMKNLMVRTLLAD
jgi:hypothetical protein